MRSIPVMILCGGKGTRLYEETEFRPKPMVEIGGRPILWHIMKLYSAYSFKEFILCLGYKGNMIKDFFLNYHYYNSDLTVQLGNPSKICYHRNNPEENWKIRLVDTGEAAQTGTRIMRARDYLGNAEHFCLTYGDGIGDMDLKKLLAFHIKHGKIGTVTGVRPPGRFGEMCINRYGQAVEFNEKPQVSEGIINGGFFIFAREFIERYLDTYRGDQLILEREPLQKLSRDGQLMVFVHEGFWQPMDTYRDYLALNEMHNKGSFSWIGKGRSIHGRK